MLSIQETSTGILVHAEPKNAVKSRIFVHAERANAAKSRICVRGVPKTLQNPGFLCMPSL